MTVGYFGVRNLHIILLDSTYFFLVNIFCNAWATERDYESNNMGIFV